MGDAEGFDQSMIDDLMTSAEGDTVESKVADLEAEVAEIKGSVKKLLLDIRETMSVLENPFQNIQAISNLTAQTPNPAHVPPTPPIDEIPDAVEVEPVPQNISNIHDQNMENNAMGNNDYAQQASNLPDFKLVDPLSFHKTIIWGREMVEKYDSETMQELVEIFSLLGYIPDNIKEIILKITNILYENNNLDESVMDLYKLYHILNPEDPSLDSKVLDLVLNENDAESPCQMK
ncbi:hypothetical protein LI82_09490 [Methanococcoides methylutens]|uniref:Archaeal flagella protein FlaD/E domain-containing protein n=1 Tax=Methanococcoides methylutens TaxID=2226 RepID=A0A099SZ47_METMT|nr:hypothetical protein [Methanococcoides methylutens]KGK97974.1 hypothetical protein LI82_09490 [Methanococcoides methylutens]